MPHQAQIYLRISKIHVYCGSVFLTVMCVGSLYWVVIAGVFNVGSIKSNMGSAAKNLHISLQMQCAHNEMDGK
jgi:hypothetical protein